MPKRNIFTTVRHLHDTGSEHDSQESTPAERLEMMWQLAVDAWALRESQSVNQDFQDILSAFCDEGVEFLLVGAYALAVHGLPRATGDLDLWIGTKEENPQRAWRALERFGAPLDQITVEDLIYGRYRFPDWR